MADTRLYGADGRPLRPEALTTRVARPSRLGWRSAQQWRSVATALTPLQLRWLYQAVARGDWSPDFFELAEEIEERDLHYRGALGQRRLRAAGSAIDVMPASDAAADVALADEVRAVVLGGAGFHDLLLDLLDAIGKGVALIEVVWALEAGRWQPASYHRIDPRWIVWAEDGETPLLITASPGSTEARRIPAEHGDVWASQAAPLDPPAKWIYHHHRAKSGLPGRGGLAYSVATIYLLKSIAIRDWWAFSEVFGLPMRVGTYGPEATDGDIQTLIDAVNALASDAGCVLPESMHIAFESTSEGKGSSSGLFAAQVEWCDKQVSKAVVGQTMTVDAGSSRSQAEVHAEVRDDLVADDVRQIAATLTRTLVRAYCALNHARSASGWPHIGLPDHRAIDVPAIVALAGAGLRIPAAWTRTRLGIPAPTDGEDVLSAAPATRPPEEPARRSALSAAVAALHAASAAGAVSADLVAALEAALAEAEDADEFLVAAGAVGAPDALAADLAVARFRARVSADAAG